jgi:hypothetical protein
VAVDDWGLLSGDSPIEDAYAVDPQLSFLNRPHADEAYAAAWRLLHP